MIKRFVPELGEKDGEVWTVQMMIDDDGPRRAAAIEGEENHYRQLRCD